MPTQSFIDHHLSQITALQLLLKLWYEKKNLRIAFFDSQKSIVKIIDVGGNGKKLKSSV